MSDKKKKSAHPALDTEIDGVEARLYRRRADVKVRASAVADKVRAAMTSPYTLFGALGIGFGVAWLFPRLHRNPDETGQRGASVMASIMSMLNLAGMALSLFPSIGGSGTPEESADPR